MGRLTNTTLSAAVTATANQITVASATGITTYSVSAKTVNSKLFIEQELMEVTEISGTTLTVKRAINGIVAAHASGAVVWVGDDDFNAKPKGGYESSPDQTPAINPFTGEFCDCVESQWISNKRGSKGGFVLDPDNLVLLLVIAGAPTDGAAGTGFGKAGPGSLLIDITNQNLYINTNTLASPTWTIVGSQS